MQVLLSEQAYFFSASIEPLWIHPFDRGKRPWSVSYRMFSTNIRGYLHSFIFASHCDSNATADIIMNCFSEDALIFAVA